MSPTWYGNGFPVLTLRHGVDHLAQTDRSVDVIRLDEENTLKSLRNKLQNFVSAYYADSGFPILRQDSGGMKMVGYIGVSELEHALGQSFPRAE